MWGEDKPGLIEVEWGVGEQPADQKVTGDDPHFWRLTDSSLERCTLRRHVDRRGLCLM